MFPEENKCSKKCLVFEEKDIYVWYYLIELINLKKNGDKQMIFWMFLHIKQISDQNR